MSDRRPLDVVLFDAGGTLVRLDFEWMSDCLRELGIEASAAALRRGEVTGRRRYDASHGRPPRPGEPSPPLGVAGDTFAYLGGMLEAAGVPGARLDEVFGRFMKRHAEYGLWMRPMEGARATIERLAAVGLPMAVVSNSDGRAEQHLVDCRMRDGLHFVVDSQIVGVEKPDPRIFEIALARLAVAAERALYVGDIRGVDEAGARAAGLHFVLIDPFGDYATPGAPAIASIGDLPDWLLERFDPGVSPRPEGGALTQ